MNLAYCRRLRALHNFVHDYWTLSILHCRDVVRIYGVARSEVISNQRRAEEQGEKAWNATIAQNHAPRLKTNKMM